MFLLHSGLCCAPLVVGRAWFINSASWGFSGWQSNDCHPILGESHGFQTDAQARRHSTVQAPVLWPCIALGQERGRCLRRGSLSSGDTSDKHM